MLFIHGVNAQRVLRVAGGDEEQDASQERGQMSLHHRVLVSFGVLLVGLGVILVMFTTMNAGIIGTVLAVIGFCLLIYCFCRVMKSSSHNMTIPGHFLLHPPTGTLYTYEQAIALQRRLDRIRRASAEERRSIQPSPAQNTFQSPPVTPPPWEMEPPPSYETVMKTTAAVNQI